MILRLRQCLFRLAVTTACCFLLPSSSAHAAWWTLDLPMEPAHFEQLAGLPRGTPRAQWLTRLVRLANEPVGENAPDIVTVRARLLPALEAPEAGEAGVRTRLPLPVPFEAWQRALELDRRATHVDLFRQMLVDRRVGLLYHGLMGLDDGTRRALAERPELLGALWRRASGAFGTFAPALRVSDGRVVTPGGGAYAGVWERLVDRPASDPGEFVERLFRNDGGALAYVYSTLAGVDEARLRLVMGGPPGALPFKDSADRVRALVRLVRSRHPEWNIEVRPFQRPNVDLQRVLTGLVLDARGRPAGPMAERFWNDVFSASLPRPDRAADWRRDVAESEPLDVLGLAGLIIDADGTTAQRRWDAVQFVQRRFVPSEAPIDQIAWAGLGAIEAPALTFTLEHLGVHDPAVYALATRRARSLVDAATLPALTQLQAVLATLAYGRWAGSLPAGRTAEWAAEILRITPASGAYQTRLATWFDETVSSELPSEESSGDGYDDSPESDEQRIVRWLTGAALDEVPTELTWDGERYRVDPGAGEFDRIIAVRRRQAGPSLSAALDLLRALRAAATAPYTARVMVADDIRTAGAALPERLDDRFGGGRPGEVASRVADRVMQISANRWRAQVREATAPLVTVADAAFTEALLGLVYAMHLGRADGPISLAPAVASRHNWVIGEPGRDAHDVWRWPREVIGSPAGWHVSGAVLGLEVALGRLRLPDLAIERVSSQPRVNANDRRTLALGVALLSPRGPSDEVRDAVAAAIGRGRERLQELPRLAADERARLARHAAWSAWRVNEIEWSLEHDRDALESQHTVGDAFWIGTGGTLPDGVPAAGWAGPRTAADGRLELEVQSPWPWEMHMGRPGTGVLTATFLDPALKALDWLAARGYPGRLAGPLVGALVVEVVYAAPLAHADDLLAMAAVVKHASPDELDDMMGQLVVDGYLRLAGLDDIDEDQSAAMKPGGRPGTCREGI